MLPVTVNKGITVNVVEFEINPKVACMVVLPVPMPAASPMLLIVATPVADEVQVTVFVRSWVEPSLKRPVAVNCMLSPGAASGLAGATASDTNTGPFTVNVVEPFTRPKLAVIVVVPVSAAIAIP